MKIAKTALALAITSAIGFSAAANATTIDGITIGPGALFEFALLAEGEKTGTGNGNGYIDVAGEVLIGIGKVVEITDGGGNILWSDTDNGRELTFVFEYTAENIDVGSDVTIGFTGGVVTVYSDLYTPLTRFERNGTQADDVARASNGNVWLTLAGSPIGDLASPEYGSLSGDPITLRSTASTLVGTTGVSLLVDGRGNLDVTGGPAGPYLDTNLFSCTSTPGGPCPDLADKTFTTSGQLVLPTAFNGWGFLGTGELKDNAIPEPSTLILMGLGIFGLGYSTRRQQLKQKN